MAFGKPKKVEESINDKFVRLFKEGMTVEQISKEHDVKPDVIANVIRRRLGEDALPETVVRSKNAVPHTTEVKLKADAEPAAEENNAEAPAVSEPEPAEGLNKLEQFMLEKEKKKAEKEPEPEPEPEPEEVGMEGISLDEATILAKLNAESAANNGPVSAPVAEPDSDMAGIETSGLDTNAPIEEAPIAAYSEPDIVEEPVYEPEPEPESTPAPAPVSRPAPAPVPSMGNGGAFDKMKAFAKMQIAANNDKIEELESKLAGVEGDFTERLETAEKAVAEAKVSYEEIIKKGDDFIDRETVIKNEHRASLARADEEYRRKLAELEEEYNESTARANREYAEKQDKLNTEKDQIDAQKEAAKQDFLTKQREVNKLRDKNSSEIEPVRAEIASLKEENKGYESFLK